VGAYAKQQDSGEAVLPLMVLQVPNTPNPNDMVGTRYDSPALARLARDVNRACICEHTTQKFGKYSVPYISPERVQDETQVRVLLAKMP